MTWDPNLSWFLNVWREAEEDGIPPYMVFTAQQLQMGKTTLALYLAEEIEEKLHGRKYDIKYLALTPIEFVSAKQEAPEWCPTIGDELNRIAGNREWFRPESKIVAEDLQTTAFEHKPAFFTMPHQHLADNAIVDHCSSQAIVDRKGHVVFYWRERDQFNRNAKIFTHRLGSGTFDKPSASLWNAYKKKRAEFTELRNRQHLEKLRQIQDEAARPVNLTSHEALVRKIMSDRDRYKGVSRRVSVTKVMLKEKIPYSRAQMAASEANDMIKAEEEERSGNTSS
jgi:hypothetical protein